MNNQTNISKPAGEDIVLFAKAKRIYPKEVHGFFRYLRWAVFAVLFVIYYGAPWLRWDRGPHVPDQAILIDMINQKAYFFWFEIWPQEVYYLTGLLVLAAIGLFFVTALLGRVWCGYACPQTVWTELFVQVERWVQGRRVDRQRLDEGPWTFEKIWKKMLTHIIWIFIGLITGGAWTLYFTDAPTLIGQMVHLQVPWDTLTWIVGLTFSTYIMAGFAREQVCTYMCPYARFQSAMFDKDTLIIGYDEARGEPRGKHKKGESWEGRGHCIDCTACVQVCPVGIDIRDGLQSQCIACGLCIDACDTIMDKLELPRGLIKYDTERNQKSAIPNLWKNLCVLRPRTLIYAVILCVVGGAMLYGLLTRSPVQLNVLHERNPLFVTLSNGEIRNSYSIRILNRTHADMVLSLNVDDLSPSHINVIGAGDTDTHQLHVLAQDVGTFRVQISAPAIPDKPRHTFSFRVKDNLTGAVTDQQTIFISGRP